MNTYISLLRGINVSGQKKIRMAELKELYESIGLSNVATYIQSGNVVFNSQKDKATVTNEITKGIQQSLGYDVAVILRQPEELARILANNPFLQGRNEDPRRLLVTFLERRPEATVLEELSIPKSNDDEYVMAGEDIYLFCPEGYGRSKLSNNVFERKLGLAATTRNWRTINKLYEMSSEISMQDNT